MVKGEKCSIEPSPSADATEARYASSKYQGTAVGGTIGFSSEKWFRLGFCERNLDFLSACVGAAGLGDFTNWFGSTSGLGVGRTGS